MTTRWGRQGNWMKQAGWQLEQAGRHLPWIKRLAAVLSQWTVAMKECWPQMLDLSNFPEKKKVSRFLWTVYYFLEYWWLILKHLNFILDKQNSSVSSIWFSGYQCAMAFLVYAQTNFYIILNMILIWKNHLRQPNIKGCEMLKDILEIYRCWCLCIKMTAATTEIPIKWQIAT